MENELDEVITNAGGEDEQGTHTFLLSRGYGFGNAGSIPTTARRRLQHSVQLARRVVEMQKRNAELEKRLGLTQERVDVLSTELKSANELLQNTQQPYHFLVDAVRAREAEAAKYKEHVQMLVEDVK